VSCTSFEIVLRSVLQGACSVHHGVDPGQVGPPVFRCLQRAQITLTPRYAGDEPRCPSPFTGRNPTTGVAGAAQGADDLQDRTSPYPPRTRTRIARPSPRLSR